MVNEERAGIRRAGRNEASVGRPEEAGAIMAEVPVGDETLQVGGTHPSAEAGHLRVVPGDGEGNGGVEQGAEVVGVVSVLREVVGVHQHETANSLLKSRIELVAEAGADGHSG